jgi:hypothetical protein
MKQIDNYIVEKLHINKDSKYNVNHYVISLSFYADNTTGRIEARKYLENNYMECYIDDYDLWFVTLDIIQEVFKESKINKKAIRIFKAPDDCKTIKDVLKICEKNNSTFDLNELEEVKNKKELLG